MSVRWVVGLIAFVLVPVASLGYGSWLGFLVAAIRYSYLGRRVALLLWGSAVVHLAAAVGMVVTANTEEGTFGEQLFFGFMLLAVAGAMAEAFILALVAAISGHEGRTPVAFRSATNSTGGDGGDSVGSVAGESAAEPLQSGAETAPAPTADRHRFGVRLGVGLLWLFALGFTSAMGSALYQYEQATSCSDPSPSDPCIRSLPGEVSVSWRKDDRSRYDMDYVLTITLRETGQRVEVWRGQPRPVFQVGEAVALHRWKGRDIAVAGYDHHVDVNAWNPEVDTVLLVIMCGSTVVAGLLRMVGLISLDEHPRGRVAVLRSALGLIWMVAVVSIGSVLFGTALADPGVYLSWW